jgi:hypothetical protein
MGAIAALGLGASQAAAFPIAGLPQQAAAPRITQPAGTTTVGDVLARARTARYQATYGVRMAIPIFAEPSSPGSAGPAGPADPAFPPTPPPIVGMRELTGTMAWTIQPPQRRFDAQITGGLEHLDPARVQPGSVPDPTGVTPSFFFDGPDAYLCEDRSGTPACSPVPPEWAQWAMPLIGQTPLLFFAFLAEMDEAQLAPLIERAAITGSRMVLGESATCLTVELMGPIEACFSPSGVPVRIVAPDGRGALEATGYQLQVDAARFVLPAPPAPGLVGPSFVPMPPGADPQQMAQCLADTGDPAWCTEQLTSP